MEQPIPLFVFSDFDARDAVTSALGLREVLETDAEINIANDCVVRFCLSDRCGAAYVTTLRIPGGKDAFHRSINNLWTKHGAATVMLCFHPELPNDAHNTNGTMYANPSASYIFHLMNVNNPSDEEMATLTRAIPAGNGRGRRPVTHMFIDMLRAFSIPPQDHEQEEDDDDGAGGLEAAMRASMAHYEQMREQRAKERVPVPKTWEQTLAAQSEPAEPNQPVCVVCLDKKATVCFVDCGHQVTCDDCVREMWSRVDVAHECPVCKADVTRILRPYWSAAPDATKKHKAE